MSSKQQMFISVFVFIRWSPHANQEQVAVSYPAASPPSSLSPFFCSPLEQSSHVFFTHCELHMYQVSNISVVFSLNSLTTNDLYQASEPISCSLATLSVAIGTAPLSFGGEPQVSRFLQLLEHLQTPLVSFTCSLPSMRSSPPNIGSYSTLLES